MSMSIPELHRALRSLRLSGMIATLEARAMQVASHETNFLEAFSWLVQDELDRRRSRLLDRRYSTSGLPERKDLNGFDWRYNPKVPKRDILELATLKFIDAREGALLIGQPGTGKSHCAKAIAQLAVQRGYKVFYREAHVLIDELHEAREFGELRKYLAQLNAAELMVIDDLFLRKQAPRARRRRARRCADEPLREVVRDHHIQQIRGRLGKAPGRRRCHRASPRPHHASRLPAEVRG